MQHTVNMDWGTEKFPSQNNVCRWLGSKYVINSRHSNWTLTNLHKERIILHALNKLHPSGIGSWLSLAFLDIWLIRNDHVLCRVQEYESNPLICQVHNHFANTRLVNVVFFYFWATLFAIPCHFPIHLSTLRLIKYHQMWQCSQNAAQNPFETVYISGGV